ncbi:MAG: type II toxin-antitoxin system RelE/ParE family toxin [Myxococcaceae bacterium]
MIRSFGSKLAEDIYDGTNSRDEKARRLLDQINAATRVETLDVPPSNKLRKLAGNLSGFWRIKINPQWAIIFHWVNGEAWDIDIVDYH